MHLGGGHGRERTAMSNYPPESPSTTDTISAGGIEGPVLRALLEVFSEDLDGEHAIGRTLQALGENLGCRIVARWTVDPGADGFRLAELWHAPPAPGESASGPDVELMLELGTGLAGQVGNTGR